MCRLFTPRACRDFSFGLAVVGVIAAMGCKPPPPPPVLVKPRPASVDDLGRFRAEPIGRPIGAHHPWVANVAAADLDRDGLLDALVCESQDHELLWLRQVTPGKFEETVIGRELRAPVHAAAADLDGDGDLDVMVASMGMVYPNNDRIGTLFILENDGAQRFTPRIVMENVARVTDVQAGDFNRDGRIDLAVAQFGYDQGEVQWLERTGAWEFQPHQLVNLAGAINVGVADFDGNGAADIVTLISQQWEEVHLFSNDGSGRFTAKKIWGSTNDDFASSNLTVCDLNRDGRPDVLFSNGDGFGPAAEPGPRPWHGVQWLENVGNRNFKFARVGDLAGAYSPVAVDLDQDGATDVAAVSAFNDWSAPKAVSLVWFRNDGKQNFAPRVLAYEPTHLLGLVAGEFAGKGQPPALISGAFHAYPPYDRRSRLLLWRPVSLAP